MLKTSMSGIAGHQGQRALQKAVAEIRLVVRAGVIEKHPMRPC
jgi:hypothetical protein